MLEKASNPELSETETALLLDLYYAYAGWYFTESE